MQKTKSASTTRKDKSKEVRLRRPQPGNLRQNIPTPNKVLTACCRKGGCSLGGRGVALCQCGWKVSHKLDYSNVNFNFDHVRSNLIAIQILMVHTSSQSVSRVMQPMKTTRIPLSTEYSPKIVRSIACSWSHRKRICYKLQRGQVICT